MGVDGEGSRVPPLPRPPADRGWQDSLVEAWDAFVSRWASFRGRRAKPALIWLGLGLAFAALVATVGVLALNRGSGVPPEELLPTVDAATYAPPTPTPPQVVVHVAGAVQSPGVRYFDGPVRVGDVIAEAGGLADGADADRLNLAAVVPDGARVFVPFVGQEPPAAIAPAAAGSGKSAEGPLDINSATTSELEELPGVGPATAAAIVGFRDDHGPFASVGDLDRVAGIGPAKLEQLRPLVVVR